MNLYKKLKASLVLIIGNSYLLRLKIFKNSQLDISKLAVRLIKTARLIKYR